MPIRWASSVRPSLSSRSMSAQPAPGTMGSRRSASFQQSSARSYRALLVLRLPLEELHDRGLPRAARAGRHEGVPGRSSDRDAAARWRAEPSGGERASHRAWPAGRGATPPGPARTFPHGRGRGLRSGAYRAPAIDMLRSRRSRQCSPQGRSRSRVREDVHGSMSRCVVP